MASNTIPVVLYIEDNQDNRKLVDRVLRAAGFTVVGVEDGIAGLKVVDSLQPDIILVDIQLPEIDGYTVTRKLRKKPKLSNVPIIALTANVLKEDQEKSLAAGCNGFIHKPIDIDLLPQQVHSFIKNQQVYQS